MLELQRRLVELESTELLKLLWGPPPLADGSSGNLGGGEGGTRLRFELGDVELGEVASPERGSMPGVCEATKKW